MLRKLLLKIGLGKFKDWVVDAKDGKLGPEAKAQADWIVAHAWWIGFVLGVLVLALGVVYGPDSNVVSLLAGTVAPTLISVGFIPASWKAPVNSENTILKILRNSSAEIGLILSAWLAWSATTCVAQGGVHVLEIVIPCGLSTLACAFVFGTGVQLGFVSDAALAAPPKK